jgi:hypothetical protein
MPVARNIPMPVAPGVVLNQSEYEAQGRYIDCDKIRFVDGKPEKIGGWEQWNTPGDELDAVCRSIFCWQDFSYNLWHAFGTAGRLWVFDQDKTRTNITPFVSAGTLSNPFSSTNGSALIYVEHTAHGRAAGDYVQYSGAATLGGNVTDTLLNAIYEIESVPDADHYYFRLPIVADTTTLSGGGASVAYSYEMAEGNASTTYGGGWGLGPYGNGTYGTERSSTTYQTFPRFWSLDKYGQYLIAMPSGGGLYEWQLNTANRAALVANAPATGLFAFITSERIIVVLGADGDFMLMKWCDDDDNTVWTPAPDNTANIRRLQVGSRLVAGVSLHQQINLVWSDTAAYLMQFLGNNEVYSTRVVGTQCGLVGPGAFCVVHGVAFWMSPRTFHMFNGSVEHVPNASEVEEIFHSMSETQRSKVSCHVNLQFREVWWTYPSTNATEPDRYVAVSIEDWSWTIGTLGRTAFGTQMVQGVDHLYATDETGVIYEHETGVDADGDALAWHIETAFMDIDSGNVSVDIDGYIPDFKRHNGDITLTWTSKEYPESTGNLETVTKTIAEGQEVVDLRHFGRQVKFELSQEVVGGDFRLGQQRVEIGTSGRRR